MGILWAHTGAIGCIVLIQFAVTVQLNYNYKSAGCLRMFKNK